jgi:hypothetical protein
MLLKEILCRFVTYMPTHRNEVAWPCDYNTPLARVLSLTVAVALNIFRLLITWAQADTCVTEQYRKCLDNEQTFHEHLL